MRRSPGIRPAHAFSSATHSAVKAGASRSATLSLRHPGQDAAELAPRNLGRMTALQYLQARG